MAKVITFSTVFPGYHRKKGQPTHFVEKFIKSRDNTKKLNTKDKYNLIGLIDEDFYFSDNCLPKGHTIRSGHRWKVGDKFSPRIWSGRAYFSKQIIIAPDTEIKKIWNITIQKINEQGNGHGILFTIDGKEQNMPIYIAKNDGLSDADFLAWFNVKEDKPFSGQIICWDERGD